MHALRHLVLYCALAALLLLAGCGGKRVKAAKPPRIGSTETGIASWYGHPYHGRQAANGEIYDMEKLTAAHRTLPFNTWVRVRNLSNEREVDVRIQDRGPFIRGRIIDLSKAAAREIELLGPGVSKVKLTIIAPPRDLDRQPEVFTVQVGSFRELARAEALRDDMRSRFGEAQIVQRAGDPPMWRVVVGRHDSAEAAETMARQIQTLGGTALVVRLDSATTETP
ncbi:MAG TPA: septal ring lytic transglycosylase RlpA family protein [Bryobacteraceae bacterium]|nr:septal ring lytic transglycosylase RlpA family protein [Bryobacteraceae bacterium]